MFQLDGTSVAKVLDGAIEALVRETSNFIQVAPSRREERLGTEDTRVTVGFEVV